MGDWLRRLGAIISQADIIFERERERERESSIPRCRDNVAYENYKVAKREVKGSSRC